MSKNLAIAVSTGGKEVNLSPGEVYEGEFFVIDPKNDEEPVSYTVSVAPLSFENETYDVYFDYPMDYNQIVDWIELEEKEGELENGGKKSIKYRITVPEDAPAGGQYAAFLVRPTIQESDSRVGVSVSNKSQVAVLLYSTISGETKKSGSVIENKIGHFFLSSPIKSNVVLTNTGNVHTGASFKMSIESAITGEELYSNEEEEKSVIVIPGTTHYSEYVWDQTPELGIFKVRQEVEYLEDVNISDSFVVVCPVWLLILCFAFLFSCILYLFEKRSRKRLKKS